MSSFNLADLFEIVADAVPDRLALVAGDVRLTYAELDARSNQAAAALAGAGVGPGDRVSILAVNRAEWVEAQLAAYKLRAAPVNVNYRYTAGELAHVIKDSGSTALVGERSLLARLGSARSDLPDLRFVMVLEDGDDTDVPDSVGYEEALAGTSPERVPSERSGDDLFLLYTGGTTGLPKGVMWRSEDIFFQAMGGGNMLGDPIERPEQAGENAEAGGLTIMCNAPLMHAAGTWICWAALSSGSKLVLWSEPSFSASGVLELASREGVQVMTMVGDAMARPVADFLDAHPGAHDLSSLVVIAAGGSATSPDVKERLHRAIPSLLMYVEPLGGSETGTAARALDVGPDGVKRFAPQPDAAVLNEKLQRVEPGSDEIGYWNDPVKTAATFVTDEDGVRWSLQGDMMRVDAEGNMILLGRGSTVVNTGGEKVYVDEVEAVLKSHPAVYDALVVGVPDERLGQRVTAVISVTAPVSEEELREHCRAELAGYKIPKRIHVVDEVARTPTGKADYRWAKETAVRRG